MFELHPVTLKDKAWIDPIVLAENSPSADYNFGNIFLWDETYKQQVGRLDGRLIVLPSYEPQPFFAWPVGSGALPPVLAEMRAFSRAQGFPFVLRGVTADHLPLVRALYGDSCTVEPERDLWDYLYAAEKLDTLSGKHLHAKRNHINRFEQENAWRFTPLRPEDIPACRWMLDKWMETSIEDDSGGLRDEYLAIQRAFTYFGPLGLDGGVLWVDGEPVAFSIGEMAAADTFDAHFEKAYAHINGAYPMINREFVRYVRSIHPQVRWINREDDTGRPSLRQSKLSYHPDGMVEKYKVVLPYA